MAIDVVVKSTKGKKILSLCLNGSGNSVLFKQSTKAYKTCE